MGLLGTSDLSLPAGLYYRKSVLTLTGTDAPSSPFFFAASSKTCCKRQCWVSEICVMKTQIKVFVCLFYPFKSKPLFFSMQQQWAQTAKMPGKWVTIWGREEVFFIYVLRWHCKPLTLGFFLTVVLPSLTHSILKEFPLLFSVFYHFMQSISNCKSNCLCDI